MLSPALGLDWSFAMSESLPTSSTIDEFRKRHKLGRSLLYELWAQGKGPRRIKIGERIRITDADERDWLDKLRAEADGAAK
jgi:predicted DNA-binding transcriptional regulator AlpA